VLRCIDELGLLGSSNARGRTAKTRTRALPHFNEYQRLAMSHDEIDFSLPAAEILFNEVQSLFCQVVQCEIFGLLAGLGGRGLGRRDH